MKKWLYLIAAFTAIGVLSRLPHPAQDIAKLDPVQAVYLYMEDGLLHLETDTGSHGSGSDLPAAFADLRANAEKDVYLDTAEFLILHPNVPITEDFFTILSPSCRVCYTTGSPDLPTAAQYLSTHPPDLKLSHLRASLGNAECRIENAE